MSKWQMTEIKMQRKYKTFNYLFLSRLFTFSWKLISTSFDCFVWVQPCAKCLWFLDTNNISVSLCPWVTISSPRHDTKYTSGAFLSRLDKSCIAEMTFCVIVIVPFNHNKQFTFYKIHHVALKHSIQRTHSLQQLLTKISHANFSNGNV